MHRSLVVFRRFRSLSFGAALLFPVLAMAEPPLIPRKVIFAEPARSQPRISPDGARLAYLAPYRGVLNIWLQTPGRPDARPVTRHTEESVWEFFWTADSRGLLYRQDQEGDERYALHHVDLASGKDRVLIPARGVSNAVRISRRRPHHIVVSIKKKNECLYDAYLLDLRSEQLRLIAGDPGNVLEWFADDELLVRAARAVDRQGRYQLLVRGGPAAAWRETKVWEQASRGEVLGFSKDGKSLLLLDDGRSDTTGICRMEIDSGEVAEIFNDPDGDIVQVLRSPDGEPVAVATERARTKWHVLDQRYEEDVRVLSESVGAGFIVVSRSREDRLWIAASADADRGPRYWLYDRNRHSAEPLFEMFPELAEYVLAPVEPVEIAARDGLKLIGYLTVPPWESGASRPMILLPHGGPYARDSWGFDRDVQWLANRGYIVLQVNFRGSEGLGKAFLRAGFGEWGGRMQDDLTDAVRWAVANAGADPERVGILGFSYGGYAALAGVVRNPGTYAAAVDVFGPTDLIAFVKRYSKLEKFAHRRIGDPRADRASLIAQSPYYQAGRVKTPLLIFHGKNDPRVYRGQSHKMARAVRDGGSWVVYVLYPDEGHGLSRLPNRLDYAARTEAFLARHLGGRAEPGSPPEESSAVVRTSEMKHSRWWADRFDGFTVGGGVVWREGREGEEKRSAERNLEIGYFVGSMFRPYLFPTGELYLATDAHTLLRIGAGFSWSYFPGSNLGLFLRLTCGVEMNLYDIDGNWSPGGPWARLKLGLGWEFPIGPSLALGVEVDGLFRNHIVKEDSLSGVFGTTTFTWY